MPPVIIGAAIAAAGATAAAVLTGAVVATFAAIAASFLVNFAVSLVIGIASEALLGNSMGDFGGAPRTVNVTDPITSRRVIVGEIRVGGPRIYFTTTDNNKMLHIVVAHADHEVDSFQESLIDGEPVKIDRDGGEGFEPGSVLGRFGGMARILDFDILDRYFGDSGSLDSHARIKVHRGEAGQVADPDLVSEVDEWTTAHIGNGIAYTYGRFRYNADLFDSAPMISAIIRGLMVYDPRDGEVRWTRNPALIKRWYLTDQKYGLGASDSEINDASVVEAANICDEMVAVVQTSDDFSAAAIRNCSAARKALKECEQAQAAGESVDCTDAQNALDACLTPTVGPYLWRATENSRWLTGDQVQLTTTGTLPAPLAIETNYYVIAVRRRPLKDFTGDRFPFQNNLADLVNIYGFEFDNAAQDHNEREITFFQLAASYADAQAGAAISITSLGSGNHTVTRTAEPRYSCDGLIDTAVEPERIMQALNTSDAGQMVKLAGQWHIRAGAWRAPDPDDALDEDSLRGPIRVTTLVSRSDLANGVKGVFVDPYRNWEPADFPPVKSDAYKAIDGGQRLWRDLQLPFTLSPSAAQRIAKIILLRGRQQIAAELPCKLSALNLAPGDVVPVTLDRFGWTDKNFEVAEWGLAVDQAPAPQIGVDLLVRETDSSVFDWSTSEESTLDPAPNTDIPNPFLIPAPAKPAVTEDLYVGRDGAGVKARAILSWAEITDAFVDGYIIEYRLAGGDWVVLPKISGTQAKVDDLTPGAYEFRLAAINAKGGFSDYSEVTPYEILGLLAPPAAPTGLTVQTISAMAILTWDRHPDLDVRIGGKIRIRWSPAETGASWNGAVEVTDPLPGDATTAVVPLRDGSYLIRAYDSSDVPSSGTAVVSTRAAEHLTFSTLSTVTESPTYPGSHAGTVAIDGILKLGAAGLFDDIPDFDAVAALDSYGGVAAAGTYDFAGGIDLGSIKTVRLTASVTPQVKNVLDMIDDRPANVDDWEDWDGVITADADLQMWFRETDDDPAGTPAWGDWRRLTAGDRNARAFEFQARLSTQDPAYNIEISALSVKAEEIV